ncbi:MAG: D-aminoacyl-tRNA deacylase [Ndongobacter sp.]|nr:D-aminoacyl-tRNA deacylase [Ndongobacter sp.]
MRAVVQRVDGASVHVAGKTISEIPYGLMVLIGVESGDEERDAQWISDKLLHLRIFEDDEGKMNQDLFDAGGELLLVSQFTLLGDARKGRRPSFVRAERGEAADTLFQQVVQHCRAAGASVQTGQFGAHMRVELVNDGPVTILLDSHRQF